jgi:hypothetical protein
MTRIFMAVGSPARCETVPADRCEDNYKPEAATAARPDRAAGAVAGRRGVTVANALIICVLGIEIRPDTRGLVAVGVLPSRAKRMTSVASPVPSLTDWAVAYVPGAAFPRSPPGASCPCQRQRVAGR